MAKHMIKFLMSTGSLVAIDVETAARLSDILYELAEEGVSGASDVRAQLDYAIEYGEFRSELHPSQKRALQSAIYRWIEEEGYERVPEAVRSGLRYGLFADWQDDLAGTFLFELRRGNKLREVPIDLDATPAVGQAVLVQGESWIVDAVAPYPVGGDYVATVRATA